MAYNNEFANKNLINKIVSDVSIKNNFKNILLNVSNNNIKRLDNIITKEVKETSLENLFVIDGSKFDGNIKYNIDNHISLINVNESVIDIKKYFNYLKKDFPLPDEYQEITKNYSNFLMVILRGFENEAIKNDKDFFRMFFYEYFIKIENTMLNYVEEKYGVLNNKETPYETYVYLLSHKKDITIYNPCDSCRKNNLIFSYSKDKKVCNCMDNTLYPTDFLQFHEMLNTEGSNEALTTQMMLVLEKLMLINLIRNIKNNNLDFLFKISAFILDGTLAIYAHASWLSEVIAEEIFNIKKNNDILIISVEKSGQFNEHFEMINDYYISKLEPLKNKMMYLLDEKYIKENIKIYHSNKFYGEKNYFGKKIFYKNKNGYIYVINIAFESYLDKENYASREISEIQMLDELIYILDNFSSSKYKNGLSFISMANEGASLSNSRYGTKMLNNFIEEIIK